MQTVLITGGARGLGAALSEVFAKNGYNVIINYCNSENLAQELKMKLENEYNIQVLLVKCDIASEEQVKEMFKKIKEKYASIDCLVNNAAIALDNDLESKDALEFKKVLDVNLVGTYLVTKYALSMLSKGSIINITSTNALDTGYIESVDYDAAKAGVIALTHDFAKFLAPQVRVNAVAAGWIKTDMNKEMDPNFKEKEIAKIALKRFAEPREIAEVVWFLASSRASYINDAIIRVDGGMSA